MVKEMLVTVKEGDGDSSFFDPAREQAEAGQEGAEAASAAARKRKHDAACAQRKARVEAARLAHVAQPSCTRSGRESRPVVRNNPDLRGIEPRRTRNQRMSW